MKSRLAFPSFLISSWVATLSDMNGISSGKTISTSNTKEYGWIELGSECGSISS